MIKKSWLKKYKISLSQNERKLMKDYNLSVDDIKRIRKMVETQIKNQKGEL